MKTFLKPCSYYTIYILFSLYLFPITSQYNNLTNPAHHMFIAAFCMGYHTLGTVLDSPLVIPEVPAAPLPQHIKRTITEQTVEVFFLSCLMTGIIFTFLITKILGAVFSHGWFLSKIEQVRFLHTLHVLGSSQPRISLLISCIKNRAQPKPRPWNSNIQLFCNISIHEVPVTICRMPHTCDLLTL